jgi:hypothetical protein
LKAKTWLELRSTCCPSVCIVDTQWLAAVPAVVTEDFRMQKVLGAIMNILCAYPPDARDLCMPAKYTVYKA